MGYKTQGERYGGHEFHVADCYVWAEISYLDSPTDYREYLPQKVRGPRKMQQMVLLDDQATPSFFVRLGKLFLYCSMTLALPVLMAIMQEW
jgi:hypothetical protein